MEGKKGATSQFTFQLVPNLAQESESRDPWIVGRREYCVLIDE
jgi:hypothetical protein